MPASDDEDASGPSVTPTPSAAAETLALLVLEDVAVVQRAARAEVTVSAGEHSATRAALATEEGIDRAVLEAVCAVLGVAPVPALVSLEIAEHGGVDVLTAIVDDGGGLKAGSSVVRGTRAWAVAAALWAAVSAPA
jgi:hypothetical protein